MKILTRGQFLEMPKGTVFRKVSLDNELNELYGNIKNDAYPAEGTAEHGGKRPDGSRAASSLGLEIPRT